jgi:predicted nucleic acid-binding Zn finger protein
LGFDARYQAYFHRELPDDPDRILKDNPRLVAARKLTGTVRNTGESQWAVISGDTEYIVFYDPAQGAQKARCTCTWYLNHNNKRGPCKHILAVQLKGETV